MNDRLIKVTSTSGIEVQIHAKREWGSLIFIPVWLAFWTFGGIMAMKWVLHPGPSTPRGFLSLWLVGWILGLAWALYGWFRTAFGKEILSVKEGSLTIKRDILGFGRCRSFPLGSVANLRASGIFPSASNWENYFSRTNVGGGTVAFDSQGSIVRFGIQLTEPQAQEVVRELKPWLPA